MMCPSGMQIPSGLIAVILFAHGVFDFKKCPDVPESADARLSTYLCVIVFVVAVMFILLSTNLSHTCRHLSVGLPWKSDGRSTDGLPWKSDGRSTDAPVYVSEV